MTDHIAAYRDYLTEEKHSSANTLSSYIRDLTQFQSWLLSNGVTDLRKVKKETINEYLLHMTHSGKSPATVTRSTASIKSFYAYLLQCGAVKTNPAKSVVAMKVERKFPEILTNREVELFLEQPKCVDEKGFRDHAMLELLYATGIRVSELISLSIVMAAEMKRTMNDLYEAERKDDTPTPLEQAAAENDGFEEAEPADAEADDEE